MIIRKISVLFPLSQRLLFDVVNILEILSLFLQIIKFILLHHLLDFPLLAFNIMLYIFIILIYLLLMLSDLRLIKLPEMAELVPIVLLYILLMLHQLLFSHHSIILLLLHLFHEFLLSE